MALSNTAKDEDVPLCTLKPQPQASSTPPSLPSSPQPQPPPPPPPPSSPPPPRPPRTQQPAQPTPPDGGWGYFVVFASFMIHIITDGLTYSFGVFYLELLYYFEESKGATAWIASILVGVTLCSGPVSGSLVNKYGCRAVTVAGSILASACLLASVWAPNIITLYFTIGIGTGLGFGLIYLPAIVSVTCYFEKYRSLATGIAVCGSGLGTLIFAPFSEFLIADYGWRGATMICAGIVLNCIVFGALFRPLENDHENVRLSVSVSDSDSDNGNGNDNDNEREGVSRRHRQHSKQAKDEEKTRMNGKWRAVQQRQPSSARSVEDTTEYMSIGGPCNEEKHHSHHSHRIRIALSQPILIPKITANSLSRSFGSAGGAMNRRDALYQGSLDNINHRRTASPAHLDQSEETTRLYTESLGNLRSGVARARELELQPEREREREREIGPGKDQVGADEPVVNVLREMLDFSLLANPLFLLFTLSNFCTSIGFNIPYVYLLPQAEVRGIDKASASYLLSVIGVANTIGRILLGYVSDKSWVNRLFVYNLCLTVCGVSTAFSAFCNSFATFAFYCVLYGFTAGAYVGLTSVILVDLLGLNRLTSAFGLLLLFQGFASLLGPPIAGWLYDALGTYDPGFYTAGAMIALSGLMLFFIPTIQRRIQKPPQPTRTNYMANHQPAV